MNDLSIIIPTLNEERTIAACLASVAVLASGPLGAEVIVVDGGSRDATVALALEHGAHVVVAERGRGTQLHAGACAACGGTFLFLHADSRLSASAASALAAALEEPDFMAGAFTIAFEPPRPLYRLYAWFSRFDSVWTTFGDQGIVIRRGLYERLGGFAPFPLLEDVALLRAVRRRTHIRILAGTVITSARRFEATGAIRQQLRNSTILLRYLLGADPHRLARLYSPCEVVPAAVVPAAIDAIAEPIVRLDE